MRVPARDLSDNQLVMITLGLYMAKHNFSLSLHHFRDEPDDPDDPVQADEPTDEDDEPTEAQKIVRAWAESGSSQSETDLTSFTELAPVTDATNTGFTRNL